MSARSRLALLLMALAGSIGLPATTTLAQSCTFTMSNINFGSVDLALNTTFTATGTFTANCSGLSLTTVRVCPSFGAGTDGSVASGDPRRMVNGGNQLAYNLFSDPGMTTVWGSYFWGAPPTPPTINISLNLGGTGSATATVYARINAGQTALPVGAYLSTFSGAHTLVAYATTILGIPTCAQIGTTNATQVPFTVSATNIPSCSVAAPTLDFGAHGVLDGNVDATTTLSVTCANGLAYTVGLNGGLSGASNPTQRKMSFGGQDITYGLYRDAARSQPWGDTIGSNTAGGTGTGTPQSLAVYGRVVPQSTPQPGTYQDTVVITVTY